MKRQNNVHPNGSPSSKRSRRSLGESEQWPPTKRTVWVQVPDTRNTATHYTVVGDELKESSELVIVGETNHDNVCEDDDDMVPVRTLDQFTLFDKVTREFISTYNLLEEVPRSCIATGIVRAFAHDDTAESYVTPGQRVMLSSITEFNIHWIEDDVPDPRIYIQTKYAWYILVNPERRYASYHQQLQKHHYITHSVLTRTLKDPDGTTGQLLTYLTGSGRSLGDFLPRYTGLVTMEDLTSSPFVAYFTLVTDKFSNDYPALHGRVLRSSIVTELYPFLTPSPSRCSSRTAYRPLKDIEKDVLQHADRTVVTSRVGTIAKALFSRHRLSTIATSLDLEHSSLPESSSHPVHLNDPVNVEWLEKTEDEHVYMSVSIDGTVYSAGDIVLVDKGDDADKDRLKNAGSSQAWCPVNDLANQKWFCKINYFFEEEETSMQGIVTRKKQFHAQWLEHGSKTLLQEASHSRALYWINECNDLPLECIYSHGNVHSLPAGQAEPLEDATEVDNNFFTGLTWNDKEQSFTRLFPHEKMAALSHCDPVRPCFVCGLITRQQIWDQWVYLPMGGYSHMGVDYHVNDFVYVHSDEGDGLLRVAQVTGFCAEGGRLDALELRLYGRYDHVVPQCTSDPVPKDNRRLFQTDVIASVDVDSIEGKAFVACPSNPRFKEAWVQKDDHFYCDLHAETLLVSLSDLVELHPSGLQTCDQCHALSLESICEEESYHSQVHKLRGLELFAGAGGLSTGMEMSGFVETKWAVEFSPSAVKTFRANHPNAVVYCQSTNALLQHAIETAEGHSPPPLLSNENLQNLPPMPQRGEVDFLFGGPPCQSFSMMNHHRRPDDKRSTLVCNMISYVEFYRPKYFLLENVLGLLYYNLDKQGHGEHAHQHLKMGVVKFLMRSMTTLGYQVHFRALQAGQYGAPQSRRRVIFLGSRGDVPIPQFPLPQYAFPIPLSKCQLPNLKVLYPTYRFGCEDEGHQCAPFPSVTIYDAIGDLPEFDWVNPHKVIPKSKAQVKEAELRLARGIPSFDAISYKDYTEYPGFNEGVNYAHPPLTRYQMSLRECANKVLQHYTPRFNVLVVERVWNVPMCTPDNPTPNHEDLPPRLRISRFLNYTGKKGGSKSLYGRLNSNGQFATALTRMMPHAKGGTVVHPEQKRILTVREAARAQGFPDSYQFQSTNSRAPAIIDDQMRQVGNAVPVPLAIALGREIGKALVQHWRHQRLREIAEREESPEVA